MTRKLAVLMITAAMVLAVVSPSYVFASDFSITAKGRIQLDYATYDDDKAKLEDDAEIRRLRLGIRGGLTENWNYKLEFNFSDSGNDIDYTDAYLEYKGLSKGSLYFGNQRVAQSLDDMTSSLHITFLERALPTVFATGRRLGVGYQYHKSNMGIQLNLFGEEPNNNSGGHGAGGRFYYNPETGDDSTIHLAGSLVWKDPKDNGVSNVRYRQRPESHATDVRLINTGTITDVESTITIGLEAARVWGPFSVQGEWLREEVNRRMGRDYSFDGYYAQASWFITGESRNYSKGKFNRLSPAGDKGAWELAFRYSNLNLTDGDVLGGEEDNYSFGLNWYPHKQVRLMANYIIVNTDSIAGDDDPNVFQIRAQYDF